MIVRTENNILLDDMVEDGMQFFFGMTILYDDKTNDFYYFDGHNRGGMAIYTKQKENDIERLEAAIFAYNMERAIE